MRNRRRHNRIAVNQRCWFDTENLTLYIRICNASREGLFLKTANPLPAGTKATLSWESEEKKKIIAEVEVMWSRETKSASRTLPGMGIRILNFIEGGESFKDYIQRAEDLTGDIAHIP